MEKYEEVKDIGDGNYAVVKLIHHIDTKSLFAVKYIPRGHTVCLCSYYFLFIFLFYVLFLNKFNIFFTGWWKGGKGNHKP
jgi:hypothetical protein